MSRHVIAPAWDIVTVTRIFLSENQQNVWIGPMPPLVKEMINSIH